MKGWSARIPRLIWLLNGLSLGLYAAGFWLRARAGFSAASVDWAGPAWLWVPAGIAAGWGAGAGIAAAGRRWLGLDRERAARWGAFCTWPWLALGFGLLLYPWFVKFGAALQFDVLGQVRAPWQAAFTALPPAGYLLLLWAGPWLVLPPFLFLASAVYMAVLPSAAEVRVLSARVLIPAAFAFFALLGCWSTTVYPPTGDEPHYLLMSESLLHEHDLDLSDNLARRDFQKFYPAPALDFHGAPTPRRGLISKHFPLLSLLLLPGYALAGRFGAALMIMLAAACAAWVIYRIALESGAAPAAALAVWGAAVLCPPLGVYYDLIYTELPAALVFLLGVWAWLRGGSRGVLLAAAAAVCLPWFYPKYVPLAALLGLSLPWARGAKIRDLAVAAGLALVSGGALVLFFRATYGYGVSGNPFGELHPLISAHAWGNALGLLADRDFGLVPAAPWMLLGVAGAAASLGTRFRAAGFALAALGVQYLLYASFDDFTGSSAAFSRQMIPGVLLLLAWTAAGQERLARVWPAAGRAGGALLVAGGGISWICAAWPMLRYLSPKSLIWAKLGWAPAIFPSLASHPGRLEETWALAWIAVFGWVIWRILRKPEQA